MGSAACPEFGPLVRRLRLAKNLSERECARAAGINCSYLHMIETGDRNPPKAAKVVALARVLEVPARDLLRAAGLINEADETAGMTEAYVRRAFRFACTDPKYAHGLPLLGEEVALGVQRFVAEMYARVTGLDVLRDLRAFESGAIAPDVD